jgi:SHS2 domain-containing protein
MTQGHWEHFEHEADMGVVGVGPTRGEAFAQAALAMTAIVTDLDRIEPRTRVSIECEEPDDELLFVDWLNAVIYEMSSKRLLFCRFAETIDRERHQPVVEIKGATYTALRVYQDEQELWHAQTVVDV